jgi:hypothetical protein
VGALHNGTISSREAVGAVYDRALSRTEISEVSGASITRHCAVIDRAYSFGTPSHPVVQSPVRRRCGRAADYRRCIRSHRRTLHNNTASRPSHNPGPSTRIFPFRNPRTLAGPPWIALSNLLSISWLDPPFIAGNAAQTNTECLWFRRPVFVWPPTWCNWATQATKLSIEWSWPYNSG